MNHAAAPMVFEPTLIRTAPHVTARGTSSCCQQAVVEALETAGSMGAIATMTMLTMGFAVGLTTAWMLFG